LITVGITEPVVNKTHLKSQKIHCIRKRDGGALGHSKSLMRAASRSAARFSREASLEKCEPAIAVLAIGRHCGRSRIKFKFRLTMIA
jgi:hypothetical protein